LWLTENENVIGEHFYLMNLNILVHAKMIEIPIC